MTHPVHPAHVAHDAQVLPLAERLARPVAEFLGTGRYLMLQSMVIVVWVAVNVAVVWARWDPYPFILLNLVFSTQASYAAPLILLAQNRQASLDRARADHDHQASEDNLALTRATHDLVLSMCAEKEES